MGDQTDLIYQILLRLEDKIDVRLDKVEEHIDKVESKIEKHVCAVERKIDNHKVMPHTITLSAKQITAITGVIVAVGGIVTGIIKLIV